MSATVPPFGRTPEVTRTALTAGFPFDQLGRWPAPEDATLQAHDAADLLLLDTFAAWTDAGHAPDPVVVLDDRHGALSLPLVAAGRTVRLGQDALSHERSVHANARRLLDDAASPDSPDSAGSSARIERHPIGSDLLAGARTVLVPLPRSLEALEQTAHRIAEHAHQEVVVLAGGRDKHLTPRMNEVLARHFCSVVPGLGRSKARVLTARGPRRGLASPFPRTAVQELPDVGAVTLAAYGATFGGPRLDPGTRLLLEQIAASSGSRPRDHQTLRAVDVGCGNGVVAVWLALRFPGWSVVATDQSADACASTRLSAEANGVQERIEVLRDDALSGLPDASEELLLLNPPFHDGSTVDPGIAHRLLGQCARVLRPGGELWCVWNSHLQNRSILERALGPTRQLARNRRFTVTVSTRRDDDGARFR